MRSAILNNLIRKKTYLVTQQRTKIDGCQFTAYHISGISRISISHGKKIQYALSFTNSEKQTGSI